MKIKSISLIPTKIRKSLLRIEADTGVFGIAEAEPLPSDPKRYSVLQAYLENVIKPVLIGEDPLQIERHWETLAEGKGERFYRLPARIVGIVDIALWDLFGKEVGQPVYKLMGGAARTDIPLYWSVGSGWKLTPEEMVAQVQPGIDAGYESFKIRMDWRGWRQDIDPAKDYEMFRLTRKLLGPKPYLGFDANNGYSVSTAIQQGRKFEELGIDHFEEPLPHHNLPGLRQVSDALDVAVSAGEQDAYRWWFEHLVLLGNPDILQPDILSAGGPSEVKRIYDMCTVLDKPVMPHSPTAGVNSMASIHVYSTVQAATRPHEFSTEFSAPAEDIAHLYGDHVVPSNGRIQLTDKAGFGIELNESALPN